MSARVDLLTEPKWRDYYCSMCGSLDLIGYATTPVGGYWVCGYHYWLLKLHYDFRMKCPFPEYKKEWYKEWKVWHKRWEENKANKHTIKKYKILQSK